MKAGDFVVHSWGATMRGAAYYEVLVVSGSKVILGQAKTSFTANGYDSGHLKLEGSLGKEIPLKRAKLSKRGLKLCREGTWLVEPHYWYNLEKANVGDTEYTYGD